MDQTVLGIKDNNEKISYQEIDPVFVYNMAKRMNKNKDKYPVNNWKKPIDPFELLDAVERHVADVKNILINGSPIHGEDSLQEHLAAIACNSMILNYQCTK